jgi:membrane-associated protease RseP (regulator of RpoE activity)
MKHLLRPYKFAGVLLLAGSGALLAPGRIAAQALQLVQFVEDQEPSMLLLHSSQGYLGVDLSDVDKDKAQALKLKEVRGAVITLIDHDAPAGQIKLQINDVVLQLNGQPVEGAEQLRRMLREVPAGHKVTLQISRDGNVFTQVVELADRKLIEQNAWKQINDNGLLSGSGPGMGILTGEGDAPMSGGSFHWWLMGSSLNVGALVEPLTAQMADYLDLHNGLMVKSVARKSAAAAAGLKAHDVILKVGAEEIATIADWERALHSNEGKPVQVTVLRDKKQQTVTLQVDSKHHQGEVEPEEFFPSVNGPLVAELAPEFAQQDMPGFASEEIWDDGAAILGLPGQLRDEVRRALKRSQIDPQQAEELRKQAEEWRKSFTAEGFNPEAFKLDPKAMEELKQQMAELHKDLPGELSLDQQQLDEMLKNMPAIRILPPALDRQQREQLDQLKRQMEELKALGFGDHI